MKKRMTWWLLLGGALALTGIYYSKALLATPANSNFRAATIATGTFSDIDVFNQASEKLLPTGYDDPVWISLQKTHGRSDLYVQSNTWQPGGSTGWHTHPGHSLIIVTSGSLTEYDDDCKPHTYSFSPGQPSPTLVDPGHGHVHIIRNEGTVPASSIAVQLVPYDPNKQNRRIDAPAPSNCSYIY